MKSSLSDCFCFFYIESDNDFNTFLFNIPLLQTKLLHSCQLGPLFFMLTMLWLLCSIPKKVACIDS